MANFTMLLNLVAMGMAPNEKFCLSLVPSAKLHLRAMTPNLQGAIMHCMVNGTYHTTGWLNFSTFDGVENLYFNFLISHLNHIEVWQH